MDDDESAVGRVDSDAELAAEQAQDYRYKYESEPSTSQVVSVFSQMPMMIVDPFQYPADFADDFLSPQALGFFKSYLGSFVEITSINSAEVRSKGQKQLLQHIAQTCMATLDAQVAAMIPFWCQIPAEIRLIRYLHLYCL